MLTIGEFARASGLTAKALRLYDELALLKPAAVNPGNGYRYYTPDQVERGRLMARLRSADVPLHRIEAILGAATPAAAADEVLSHWRQAEADRAAARGVIASLVAFLTEQDDTMEFTDAADLRLAGLICAVHDEMSEADDLARIGAAQQRAIELRDLGERLIDHYVTEAKLGGATWDEIGAALGDSGDVPASRRPSNAFERFTDLNRHAIVLAQEAARARRHHLIGSEHLLVGLLGEPRGTAHRLLTSGAASEHLVRDAVEAAMAPSGEEKLEGHIAFAPDSVEAIERALHTSRELGHHWVGTEHTLLGLLSAQDSPAARILLGLGFSLDGLREQVAARLEVDDR